MNRCDNAAETDERLSATSTSRVELVRGDQAATSLEQEGARGSVLALPCREWTGKLVGGYGLLPTHLEVEGECYAHRASWAKATGRRIPKGRWVLHRCDNRACFEPSHLYLGTNTENVRDRVERGRGAKGERHGMAKLSDAQVEEIHTLIRAGLTQKIIASLYRVSKTTISLIANGKRRAEYPPSTPEARAYAAASMRKSRAARRMEVAS